MIVGHSLGAGIGLSLAATAPHHVRALVLVAPAAGAGAVTVTDRVLAAPFIGSAVTWLGFRAAGLALLIPPLRTRILIDRFGLTVGEAKEVARRFIHGEVWRSFTVEQQRLVGEADRLQERLGDIRCPVVIVAGTRDRVVRPHVVAAMARRLPTEGVITTDAGHLVPMDDPETVVQAVFRALTVALR